MSANPTLHAQILQMPEVVTGVMWHIFLTVGLPTMILMAVVKFIASRIKASRRSKKRKSVPTSIVPELFPDFTAAEKPKLTARRPLTSREEKMFLLLSEALPECTILAQVSFQALIDTTSFEERNRFNRKYADFVICSKRLTPIAIIELDDASHDHKKPSDDERDAMLQSVGYQTIRYRDFPATPRIRQDMQTALTNLRATTQPTIN